MRRHLPKILGLICIAALVVAVVGCSSSTKTPSSSGGGSTGGSSTTIVEKNFAFVPNTLTVNVGDTVTFKNEDSTDHQVSIDGQDLGTQPSGQSVTWKATKDGTYPVSCLIHPTMTGEIIVGTGSGSSTNPGSSGTGGY